MIWYDKFIHKFTKNFDLNSLHDGFELIVLCPQFPVTFFSMKKITFLLLCMSWSSFTTYIAMNDYYMRKLQSKYIRTVSY